MKFTLTIELGNDAMQSPSDVLKAIKFSINSHHAAFEAGEVGAIIDYNGNRVGEWSVTE